MPCTNREQALNLKIWSLKDCKFKLKFSVQKLLFYRIDIKPAHQSNVHFFFYHIISQNAFTNSEIRHRIHPTVSFISKDIQRMIKYVGQKKERTFFILLGNQRDRASHL